jgi:hypothetical protein
VVTFSSFLYLYLVLLPSLLETALICGRLLRANRLLLLLLPISLRAIWSCLFLTKYFCWVNLDLHVAPCVCDCVCVCVCVQSSRCSFCRAVDVVEPRRRVERHCGFPGASISCSAQWG